MHPFNTTENQANNLFSIPIRYDAKQNDPQTLATPTPRDPLKEPITKHIRKKPTRTPTKTQPEPSQTSLLKVDTKRQNDNSNHGNNDAKWFKVEERKIQTRLSTVDADVQPRRSQ